MLIFEVKTLTSEKVEPAGVLGSETPITPLALSHTKRSF